MPDQHLTEPPENFDWEHVYLLGWYNAQETPYLTTWAGALPYVHVAVTGPAGLRELGPPLWKARHNVKPGNRLGLQPISVEQCQLHFAASAAEARALARQLDGVRALGWYFAQGFTREG